MYQLFLLAFSLLTFYFISFLSCQPIELDLSLSIICMTINLDSLIFRLLNSI
jgi:hypothetical protein